MNALKPAAPYKSGVVLLLIMVLLMVLISRNSQGVVRAFVAGETRWKTAGFLEEDTEHFQIKYMAVDGDYVENIGQTAEDAYVKVTQLFGYEPERKTTIIIYPDSASLARSFGWDKDEKAMGVYWAGTIRLLSPQQWINSNANWEEIFAGEGPVYHEFAHLMVDDITRGNYSRWFTEGIAQYVEKKITGFEFQDPMPNKYAGYYTFDRLEKNFNELDQQVAYRESLQIIEFMVDNYGEECLWMILKCLGEGNSMDYAINRSSGIEYWVFERDFLESVNQ